MGKGFSKCSFGKVAGVGKQSILDWEKKHEEFAEAIKQGESASLYFYEEEAIKGLKYKPNGERLNSTMAIFLMKKRFREEYGDNEEKVVINNFGGVSDADLDQEIAELMKKTKILKKKPDES